MSVSPVSPGSNPLTALAGQLIAKVDANRDGQLSMEEFGALLAGALSGSMSATNSTFAPGTAARTAAAGAAGTLEGFDPAKLANPDHRTVKYEVGRILQQYPNTPQGLRDALPALRSLFPDLRITGSAGDKLDFGAYVDAQAGRIGVVDVLRGAGEGGHAWQWMPVS